MLLLSFRKLERRLYASPQECMANALALLQEALLRGMHARDKAKILVLLRAYDAPDPCLHFAQSSDSLGKSLRCAAAGTVILLDRGWWAAQKPTPKRIELARPGAGAAMTWTALL